MIHDLKIPQENVPMTVHFIIFGLCTFKILATFTLRFLCFQLKEELSNLILSNLKPSNSTFFPTTLYNWTYPNFQYQNYEKTSVRTSVEHQPHLDSILTRLNFLPNFTSILPRIRAKVDKTKDTT